MKLEIKHRWTGNVLFSLETSSWKVCVEAAIKAGANLSSANLSSADLSSADLSFANLSSADLSFANLSSANLRYADLSSANLRSANLRSANLSFANLRSAKHIETTDWFNQCSRDILFVLQSLKPEVPYLRAKLIKGEVDGTQYHGDCACLVGTLGNADGGVKAVCTRIPYYEKGLNNYGEQWFYHIKEGDTPKNNLFAAHALKLIDMVLETPKPINLNDSQWDSGFNARSASLNADIDRELSELKKGTDAETTR